MKTRSAVLIGCAGLVALFGAGLVLAIFVSPFFFQTDSLAIGGGVGVVNLLGVIEDSRDIVEELDRHADDPMVRAVVIRIDSPGGGVAPSQEIHDAVLRLRESKPVVASIGGMAASGGYYVAVACDSIVANPGSLTGSIGVIFSYVTAQELMKKLGVRLEVYKSGETKDIGSFHREPTPEERALLEGLVNDVYDQFVDAVAAGRDLPREEIVRLADGRIFTGRQALDLDIVDTLGGLHESVLLAARMADIEGEPRLISKERRRFRFMDLLNEAGSALGPASWGPRLEYRFQ